MTEQKTLVMIDDIIHTYYQISDTMDLNSLLKMQDELSALSYNLAEIVGKAKLTSNQKYVKRKIVINRQVQHMLDSELEKAISKAQNKAEVMNEDILEQEMVAEALAVEYDLKLKQVNKVLQALQQRISFVKKEWELQQFVSDNQA